MGLLEHGVCIYIYIHSQDAHWPSMAVIDLRGVGAPQARWFALEMPTSIMTGESLT